MRCLRPSHLMLLLALPALWHCQSTVHLMPVPVACEREYYEIISEYEKLSTVDIGYATNRLIAPVGSDRFYSRDFDQDLRFGTAFVQIGDGNASWEEITRWIFRAVSAKKTRLGAPGETNLHSQYDDWARELTHTGKLDVIYIDTENIPDIEAESHDYWYTNSWVSTDTLLLLNHSAPPQEQQLQRLEENGGVYWSFPRDYDRRDKQLYSSAFREQQGWE